MFLFHFRTWLCTTIITNLIIYPVLTIEYEYFTENDARTWYDNNNAHNQWQHQNEVDPQWQDKNYWQQDQAAEGTNVYDEEVSPDVHQWQEEANTNNYRRTHLIDPQVDRTLEILSQVALNRQASQFLESSFYKIVLIATALANMATTSVSFVMTQTDLSGIEASLAALKTQIQTNDDALMSTLNSVSTTLNNVCATVAPVAGVLKSPAVSMVVTGLTAALVTANTLTANDVSSVTNGLMSIPDLAC